MEYRIIVAHPGKQHSYRLASALKKSGMLLKYCTTIYDKKDSLITSALKYVNILNMPSLIRKRQNNDLNDDDVILYNTLFGVAEAVLYRIDKSHRIYTGFQQFNASSFGKKLAKYAIRANAEAVICYDSNSYECFRYLKQHAPGIIRIMDVSHCARPYEKRIIDDEVKKSGSTELLDESSYLKNQNFLDRMQMEIDLTDYFLSPSDFINRSLISCGVKPEQILIVPYGSNAQNVTHEYGASGPLKILFVGNVNYNKGITYLIDAVSAYKKDEVSLTIVGMYDRSKDYILKCSDRENITIAGRVEFEKVCELYRTADILVIDSFAEGLAQVGLEAMSCGIPIICSTNSGVNDAVEDGENGFIVQPGNTAELEEAIKWFLENREKIRQMGDKARLFAQKFTWGNYEKEVCEKLKNVMEEDHG